MTQLIKYVEWVEPAYDLGGDNYLPTILRARYDDVAKFQRRREPRYTSDEQAVEDFLVVHWGRYKEYQD